MPDNKKKPKDLSAVVGDSNAPKAHDLSRVVGDDSKSKKDLSKVVGAEGSAPTDLSVALGGTKVSSGPPTPPPAPKSSGALVTELGSIGSRLLDLIARPGYAANNVLYDIATGNFTDIPAAAARGFSGEQKGSGRDVAGALGAPNAPIIPAFQGVPILGSTYQGAAGLLLDLFNPLDVTNYLGVGELAKGARAVTKAVPGAEAAVQAAKEAVTTSRVGQYAQAVRDKLVSTPPGPVGEVRKIMRGREGQQRYLDVQATRQAVELRYHLANIAEKYGLNPDDLEKAVTREAQEKVRQADIEAPASLQVPGQSATVGPQAMTYSPTGLVASYVKAPTVTYVIGQGETLSEIANKFGTTVDRIASSNGIKDPNRIRAGQKIDVPMPPEAVSVVKEIRAEQPARLQREKAAGVPTAEFQSDRIAYLHREITPEAQLKLRRKPLTANQVRSFFEKGIPIMSVRHGAQNARKISPDSYIHEVNQAAVEGRTAWAWVDANGQIVTKDTPGAQRQIVITDAPQEKPALPKVPIFSEDPAVIELARERMSIRAITAAQALDKVQEIGTKEGWVTKINPDDTAAAKELRNAGWVDLGQIPRFGDKMKGVWVANKEIADEIDKHLRLWDPKTQNLFDLTLAPLVRWWANQTLFAFPAYHFRNLVTGILKNYYAGLNPADAAAYTRGSVLAAYRGLQEMAPRSRQAFEAAKALGQGVIKTKDGKEYTYQQISDMMDAHRLTFSFFSTSPGASVDQTAAQALQRADFQAKKLNPFSNEGYLVQGGKWTANRVEDEVRGALFIQSLIDGKTPDEAAEIVRRWHFDYNDVPDYIKTARKYGMPFITWAYKNIPNELATLINEPRKAARIVKTVRAAEQSQEQPATPEEVPAWMNFPFYVGRDKDGNAVFSNLLDMWAFSDVANALGKSEGTFPLSAQVNYLVRQIAGPIAAVVGQGQNQDLSLQRTINPSELEKVGIQAPQGPFGMPSRVEALLKTFRPYNVAEDFAAKGFPGALPSYITGGRTYTSDPYFTQEAPAQNLQDAANYLRARIRGLNEDLQRAREAGDTRKALLIQRQIQQWLKLVPELQQKVGEVSGP